MTYNISTELLRPAAGMAGKDKGGFCNVSVRDNRVGVQFSCSAILSWPKIAVGGLGLVLIAYLLLSTWVFGGNPLLRRRVQELGAIAARDWRIREPVQRSPYFLAETKLTKRLHWFMQHRQHLSEHIKASWAPTVHPDGRKHLLSPPGGLSRLAEAVAPDGNLAVFDDHYLCGDKPLVEAEVLKLKLALAAVSWMAPRSLRNSMESWRSSGLLDIADERMLFLNSPTAEDFAIAAEFDFDVYTTTEHDGNIMAGPSSAWSRQGL